MYKTIKKKEKVYLIIHDGSNVLVGQGGKSCNKDRMGFHLPGGTKQDSENEQGTAKRELKEETNIDLVVQGDNCAQSTVVSYGNTDVHFLVIKIPSVPELVKKKGANSKIKKDENTWDEPFNVVTSKTIKECMEDFTVNNSTEWFGKGLQAAIDSGLLKK